MVNITIKRNSPTFRIINSPRTVKIITTGRRGIQGEAGEGVIAGGTTGQTLQKASNADFDMQWSNAGAGDMIASIYDPHGVNDDAFDLDNMLDGIINKSFTATEKTKLLGIAAGAEVNVNADWNSISGDSQILNKPTLGTAAAHDTGFFATAAQGVKADGAFPLSALFNNEDIATIEAGFPAGISRAGLAADTAFTSAFDSSGAASSALSTANAYTDSGLTTKQDQDVFLDDIAALTDPNADRVLFWDDSAGTFAWLQMGTNLSITGTTLNAAGSSGGTWGSITGTLSDQTDLQSALDAKQPLDSDLSTIAGLTATTNNFIVSVSSAWASRTPAQVRSTLALVIGTNVQAWDAELDALAGLTSAADKLPYFTGSGTAGLADFTTTARSLLDDSSTSAMRTTLGVAIGSNVQAWDADLDTLASLTATTDNFIVSVSSSWASRTPSQVKTTLGLVIGTDVQAFDAELAAIAGLTSAANKLPYFTGSGSASLADFTAAGRALVDDTNAAAQLITLGLTATATELNYTAGVSGAIQTQLDAKALQSTTISAGTGLAGGGSLASNRSIALSAGSIASLLLADSSVQPGDNVSDLVDNYTINIKDYGALGDGSTNNTTAIGSAITALASAITSLGAATLYLPQGTFMTDGHVISSLSNFTIKGPGILKLNRARSGRALANTYNVLTLISCTNFKIEGLEIHGNRHTDVTWPTTDRAPVTQYLQSNAASSQAVVAVADGTKFLVGERVWVMGGLTANGGAEHDLKDNGTGAGILIDSIAGNNLTLHSNLSNSYTATGVAGGAYITTYQTANGNTVGAFTLGNEDQQNGIHLITCSKFNITKCYVHDVWESGIKMGFGFSGSDADNLASGCTYGILTENRIERGYDQGISLWSSQFILAEGNYSADAGWGGVVLTGSDDCIISGNILRDNYYRVPGDNSSGYGIAIEGGARNLVAENQINANYNAGVLLSPSPLTFGVSGTTLNGNLSWGSSSMVVASATGFIAGATYMIKDGSKSESFTIAAGGISGTTLTLTRKTRFYHPSGRTVGKRAAEDNTIENNLISGSVNSYGIWSSPGVRSNLRNNTILRNYSKGLLIETSDSFTSGGTVVDGNFFSGNGNGTGAQALLVDTQSDIQIINNRVAGNFGDKGLQFKGITNSRVSNNSVTDVQSEGIYFENGGSQICDKVIVANNDVKQCDGAGIKTDRANHFIISNNNCWGNAGDGGISLGGLTYSTVIGNTTIANNTNGILLQSSNSVESTNNLIEANISHDDGTGVKGSDNSSLTQSVAIKEQNSSNNNTFANNKVDVNITIVGANSLITRNNAGVFTVTGNIAASNLSGTNTGDQDLSGYELLSNKATSTSLGTSNTLYPTQNAVKSYVDAVAQGLSVKGSVKLATATALPTNTYLAGVITVTATGTLTIDGTLVALNDRILVKDEASQLKNGVYTCTTAGAVGVAAILTRSSDMDSSAEFPGAFVFVESGTVNAAAGFVCTNSSNPTVGTTAITFTQFSGAGEITAGTGISKTANTLSIDTAVTVDKTTAQTLTNKIIQLTPLPGVDLTVSGITAQFTTNEAQAFGDLIYIDSSGKSHLAKADAIATSKVIGMATGTFSSAGTGTYLLNGFARNDAWNWTVGGFVYLTTTGTTGNTLTQTAPTGTDSATVIVGIAIAADEIFVNPQLVIVEHT